MRRWTLAVAVLAVALGGCEDRRKKAMERVGHDEELLRKVGAAVNEVVRNAADCEVAKPLMTEAYQRIAPMITVFSRQSGVNVHLASRPVLLAIPNVTAEQVDAYLAERDAALGRAPFAAQEG